MASPVVALSENYTRIWNLVREKNVKYPTNNFYIFITYLNDILDILDYINILLKLI